MVERQVERLIASPRFEHGVRAFFSDFMAFDDFDVLAKDPVIYPKFSPRVTADAREQTMRTIINQVLAQQGDYRDIFTTRKTEMTRNLGMVYRIPVAEDGWQAQWAGKRIFDDGDFAISVVRGNASGPNEVDGISGASVTSYAISDMLEFWMGEHGFGPFLDRLKKGEIE